MYIYGSYEIQIYLAMTYNYKLCIQFEIFFDMRTVNNKSDCRITQCEKGTLNQVKERQEEPMEGYDDTRRTNGMYCYS